VPYRITAFCGLLPTSLHYPDKLCSVLHPSGLCSDHQHVLNIFNTST